MPVILSFTFDGDRQIERELLLTSARAKDMRPAWEVIADSFRLAETKQFNSEGSYGGTGWAPLSPKYGAWKAKHYPGAPILVRTGELRGSLTRRPFGVEVIELDFALFGSGVAYGKYHQNGTPRMPMRKPVELPESLRRRWVKIVQAWLITGSARVH